MDDTGEKFCEVHKKRSTLIWLVFDCILLLILGCYLTKYSTTIVAQCDTSELRRICFSNPEIVEIIGQCMVLYFGLCALMLAVTVFKPVCIFYCTKEGFWSQKYGYVKWLDVKKMFPDNSGGQTNICYQIKNSDKEFVLKFQNLDTPVDVIYKTMRTYCKDE